jgi:hypothetical protein
MARTSSNWYPCIKGLMIVGAPTVAIVPGRKKFDKRLIFVKDTDILLSGNKWTIVVNIALDDYDTLVFVMRKTLEQIGHKIQVYRNKFLFFGLTLGGNWSFR